jgi:chemotaxis-related protein WspD
MKDQHQIIHIDDCWNRIGIHGDSSCQLLNEHIHCRNCPIYKTAAIKLLDRNLPTGYLDELSKQLAIPRTVTKQDSQLVLVFRLANEVLALPAQIFQEVATLSPVHKLPHQRHNIIRGLVNIRGELLICIALDILLEIEQEPDQKSYKHLLVVGKGEDRFVFPVSEVYGLHRYTAEELAEVPATLSKAVQNYTIGMVPWKKRTIGCLNHKLLFHSLNTSLS